MGPFCPIIWYKIRGSLFFLLKFQMAPRLTVLIYFGSKKKEPRYTCLRAAEDAHSQRICAKISSSAPHLLHKGLFFSHDKWRCLFRVLCPVKANNNPGLCPIKGQKSGICSRPMRWVVNLTPWPLYTWERTPWYPLTYFNMEWKQVMFITWNMSIVRRVYYLFYFWTARPILGLQVWSPFCMYCQHMASYQLEDA